MQLENLAQSLRLHCEVCYKTSNFTLNFVASNGFLELSFLLIQYIINILPGTIPNNCLGFNVQKQTKDAQTLETSSK